MPVLELGDDPDDVPQARHWVLSRCEEGGLGEDARFVVELVTTELVANAYEHGLPPVTVEVQRTGAGPAGDGSGAAGAARDGTVEDAAAAEGAAADGAVGLVISVTDRGPGSPVVREPDPDALGGRGMALVEGLTAGWGVVPALRGPGKTVWCRLAG